MVGCAFSPRYARARSERRPDPLHFCAVNLAVEAGHRSRWVMTEYAGAERSPDALRIGGTTARWDGADLVIVFDERDAPWGRRVRGSARLRPRALFGVEYPLAPGHCWRPVAPVADVEVTLAHPRVSFRGTGYHDFNVGARGLEDDLRAWSWQRASGPDGTRVVYDVDPRMGEGQRVRRLFRPDGSSAELPPAQAHALPRTRWGLRRDATAQGDAGVRIARSLEDGPFYARTWLETRWDGAWLPTVHETVELDRFCRPWVRFLTPFRMRRS